MSEEKRKMTMPVMPAKLRERLKFYDKKMPHFAPAFDRVFIIPLDDADQLETTGTGGVELVVPDEVKAKLGAQRGLLVAAGAKAYEQLYSMGIGLGDRVYTMRFSRFERTYQSKEDRRFYRVQIATAGEVMGSEDLYDQFEAGEMFMEMDADGNVTLSDREETRPRNDPPPRDYGV